MDNSIFKLIQSGEGECVEFKTASKVFMMTPLRRYVHFVITEAMIFCWVLMIMEKFVVSKTKRKF